MYDSKMNRMTAQVTFGRDYRDRTSPDLITSVPTADEAVAKVTDQ